MSAVPHTVDSAEVVSLHNLIPCPEAVSCLSEMIARRLNSVPLAISTDTSTTDRLLVGVADVNDTVLQERLSRHLPQGVAAQFIRVDTYTINVALDKCYETGLTGHALLEACAFQGAKVKPFSKQAQHMVRLVEAIIYGAYRQRASDIHVTTTSRYVNIRLRIDGVLQSWLKLRLEFAAAIAGRIKVLALMDIAEARLPQDGQFNLLLDGQSVDFRVSSFPTVSGENFVIRVLPTVSAHYSLDELGFSKDIVSRLSQCLKEPNGLIVFCGPTGSGKSTSMHTLIGELDQRSLNIMTLEDPVENVLPGIQQTNIDASRGFDYADGLRALLRQDPDVLMIGEVRDANSAHMMLRAVMTGHKLLTSVHAADALSAIDRLAELGVCRQLLAANLLCLVSQRLVRKICPMCVGASSHCQECHGAGFLGRLAVAELVVVTPGIASLVADGYGRDDLLKEAELDGYVPMRMQAKQLCEEGKTTTQELQRVFGSG